MPRMPCRLPGGSLVTCQVAGPGCTLVHPPCPPEPGTGSRVNPSFIFRALGISCPLSQLYIVYRCI